MLSALSVLGQSVPLKDHSGPTNATTEYCGNSKEDYSIIDFFMQKGSLVDQGLSVLAACWCAAFSVAVLASVVAAFHPCSLALSAELRRCPGIRFQTWNLDGDTVYLSLEVDFRLMAFGDHGNPGETFLGLMVDESGCLNQHDLFLRLMANDGGCSLDVNQDVALDEGRCSCANDNDASVLEIALLIALVACAGGIGMVLGPMIRTLWLRLRALGSCFSALLIAPMLCCGAAGAFAEDFCKKVLQAAAARAAALRILGSHTFFETSGARACKYFLCNFEPRAGAASAAAFLGMSPEVFVGWEVLEFLWVSAGLWVCQLWVAAGLNLIQAGKTGLLEFVHGFSQLGKEKEQRYTPQKSPSYHDDLHRLGRPAVLPLERRMTESTFTYARWTRRRWWVLRSCFSGLSPNVRAK